LKRATKEKTVKGIWKHKWYL